jgi:hypothetical protein
MQSLAVVVKMADCINNSTLNYTELFRGSRNRAQQGMHLSYQGERKAVESRELLNSLSYLGISSALGDFSSSSPGESTNQWTGC